MSKLVNYDISSHAIRLKGSGDELPNIRRIAASYRKQRLEVEYDKAVVTEAQIMTAAENLDYTLQLSK